MDEKRRIADLVDQGKITSEEGDRLLAVLREIDGVDDDIAEMDVAIEQTGSPAAEPTGEARLSAEAGTTPVSPAAGQEAAGGVAGSPAGTRWLTVRMLAGDLRITVDEALSEPLAEGEEETYELEPSEDGYVLSQFGGGKDKSWVDRVMEGFRRSDLAVRVPSGYGVFLDLKAGDVRLKGIPYLRGSMLAGDLSAVGLRGLDLGVSAGEVDLELTPTEGSHRLRSTAGDIEVRLGRGSSVAVEGRIGIGDASLPKDFERERTGLGHRFSGAVGSAAARLELKLSTGDLTVKVDHE